MTRGAFPILLLTFFLSAGCSTEKRVTTSNIGDPSTTLAPGDTLPIGISARIDTSGAYDLPDGRVRLSWRCSGTVGIDVETGGGRSSQQCTDSQQSVLVVGPGTVNVDLGGQASVVILTTENEDP